MSAPPPPPAALRQSPQPQTTEHLPHKPREDLTEHKTQKLPPHRGQEPAGSGGPLGRGTLGLPEAVSVTYPYQFSVQHLESQSWLEK